MLRLFSAMIDIWGAKWTSHLTDDKTTDRVMAAWQDSFADLTNQQIFDAFAILKNTEEFPPSIAKFRKTALSIISSDEAFNLAINGNEEYRKFLSTWDWSNLPEKECLRKFKAKYRSFEAELLTRCQQFRIGESGALENKSLKQLDIRQ